MNADIGLSDVLLGAGSVITILLLIAAWVLYRIDQRRARQVQAAMEKRERQQIQDRLRRHVDPREHALRWDMGPDTALLDVRHEPAIDQPAPEKAQ